MKSVKSSKICMKNSEIIESSKGRKSSKSNKSKPPKYNTPPPGGPFPAPIYSTRGCYIWGGLVPPPPSPPTGRIAPMTGGGVVVRHQKIAYDRGDGR